MNPPAHVGRLGRLKLEGMTASATFSKPEHFNVLRRLLRFNSDFADASEQLDRVEHELERAHRVKLPVPEELFQMPNRSLCLCWPELTLFCEKTTILWRVARAGEPQAQTHPETNGVPAMLLQALAFLARLQT